MILDILSIVCIGLMIGTEFAVSAFINPVLSQLDPEAEAQATSLFARKLGFVMPFWYVLNFLLLMAEAVVHRHGTGTALLATASTLWVIVIIFTLLILVPIHNRIIAMSSEGYSDKLRQQHARWDMHHRWRVAALSAAMVTLLIGIGA